jgi:deoxycytidylate deaminase
VTCVKQQVSATITGANGQIICVGVNSCLNPQDICPRADAKSGEGYDLCTSVCLQTGHAELNALEIAGDRAMGSHMTLRGHTYCCDDCIVGMAEAGVASFDVHDTGDKFYLHESGYYSSVKP